MTTPRRFRKAEKARACAMCDVLVLRTRKGYCVACERRLDIRPKRLSPWEAAQAGLSRRPGSTWTHKADNAQRQRGAV